MSIKVYSVPVYNPATAGGLVKYYGKIYGTGLAALDLSYSTPVDFPADYDVAPTQIQKDQPDMISSLLQGMGVMFPLAFLGNTYTDLQGRQITIPTVLFETVVCSISMNKNIVKENVNGRDGSIKEMISAGDWNVEVRAIIPSGNYGVYPAQNVDDLWQIIKAPIAIPISSRYLDYFDIRYLVIENVQFEQIPGDYSQQRVILSCVSDTPLIIKMAG